MKIDQSRLKKSNELHHEASKVMPGGVSSYARKFDQPISFKQGDGSRITDVDENEYIDYLQAWGAIILGHSHEPVNQNVANTLDEQDLFGMGTTQLEIEVAELIINHVPSAEKVLFGVTGSEVVARAITLARAVTGRSKIIKFQGHYHGWYDSVAMNHMSEKDALGSKDAFTEGLLSYITDETIVLPYNDEEAIENAFEKHGNEIAGVILEPVAHNMGCIPPEDGYLENLREYCDQYGSVLIFDEIITGFRHDLGGVQKIEDVTPDLTTLAKSIANGYPISALCGDAELMDQFKTSDDGVVAYGGTYNGHAGSLAAAKTTLQILEREEFYTVAKRQRDEISTALRDIFEDAEIDTTVTNYGTVFLTYFMDEQPKNYEDIVEEHDDETYHKYRHSMINQGVLMVPKPVRRNYLTASHDDTDVEKTIEAAKHSIQDLTGSSH